MKKCIAILLALCLALGCSAALAEKGDSLTLTASPDIDTMVAMLGTDGDSSQAVSTVLELLSRTTAVIASTQDQGTLQLLLDGKELGTFSCKLDATQNTCLLASDLTPGTVLSFPLDSAQSAKAALTEKDPAKLSAVVQSAALACGADQKAVTETADTFKQLYAQLNDESDKQTLDTFLEVEGNTFTWSKPITLDAKTLNNILESVMEAASRIGKMSQDDMTSAQDAVASVENANLSLNGTLYGNEGNTAKYVDLTMLSDANAMMHLTVLDANSALSAELLYSDVTNETLKASLMNNDDVDGLYAQFTSSSADSTNKTGSLHVYTSGMDANVDTKDDGTTLTLTLTILDMDVLTITAERGTADVAAEIPADAAVVTLSSSDLSSDELTAKAGEFVKTGMTAFVGKISAIDPDLGQRLAALMAQGEKSAEQAAQTAATATVVTKSHHGISLWKSVKRDEAVCEIPEGAQVTVLSEPDGNGFVEAEYNGATGYCDSQYLQIAGK